MKQINEKAFNELVLGKGGITVVDFFATWCGPCRMLAPVMDNAANELTDVTFFKVDVDENELLAGKYNISSIPCLILFKDGKAVDRLLGYRPLNDIINWIKTNQ